MSIISLALKSFRNRKFSVGLAILSVTLSVALLLGVETVRQQAKTSFTSTISGTDLIVGARSSSVNLLLYSIFRIGNPTNNIDWHSYQEISQLPGVKWSIPLSMGDSHKGFRVVGTNGDYFEYFRYARDRRLILDQGQWFEQDNEAVLGAAVVTKLGYVIGNEIVIAHGAGDESFITHDDTPFVVSGILERTGTPVDHAIYLSLEGFDHMHEDWQQGGEKHSHDPLTATITAVDGPKEHSISAFLLGLESRSTAIALQRRINEFDEEPLSAILPGVALLELWEIVGLVENSFRAISAFVIIVGLSSMLIVLTTSINERRREMAILRALGARPGQILSLMLGEASAISITGTALGILLVAGILLLGQNWIAVTFGLFIELNLLTPNLLYVVITVTILAFLIGLIPAIRMYRYSLVDGMTIRV